MTIHPGDTFPAFVRAFLKTRQRGLGYRAATCYVYLHDVLNFPTGPVWDEGLRSRIESAKIAAEAVCGIHPDADHDNLLFAWRRALERLYSLPRAGLQPEDLEVHAAFEKLAVNFNSRVWLDT